MKNDSYLETREKEDAFAERIVEAVEKKVMSNLLAYFGMYMEQMQPFPLSVSMGAYLAAQGGMVYGQAQAGALPDSTNNPNMAMQDYSVWNDVTVSKAVRDVPGFLEKQPLFLSIDDTMVEKSGKHFELCSKEQAPAGC